MRARPSRVDPRAPPPGGCLGHRLPSRDGGVHEPPPLWFDDDRVPDAVPGPSRRGTIGAEPQPGLTVVCHRIEPWVHGRLTREASLVLCGAVSHPVSWLECGVRSSAVTVDFMWFIWLGGRDSNPDNVVKSHVASRWTTSQYQPERPSRKNFRLYRESKSRRAARRLEPRRRSEGRRQR